MNELPPGLRIEHTLVQANVNGAALVLGQERILMGEVADGRIPLEPRIDWVMVLQIPSPALKRLSLQIAEIVANYEATFGSIPEDMPAKAAKPKLELVTPIIPLGRTTEVLGAEEKRPLHLHEFYAAALRGRHPLSSEYPLAEPAPSPSEQSPLSEPLSQPAEQTACDRDQAPGPSSDPQNPAPSPEGARTAPDASEEHL